MVDEVLLMEKFEERLYMLINGSSLPVSVVYFFMKKATKELESIYNNSFVNNNAEEHFEIPIELGKVTENINDEEKENNYEQSISGDASSDSGSINDN